MSDYVELKRSASAAKIWGGEVGEHRWYLAECFKRPYFSIQDAEFIAACDPGRVLALIAENDRLETERAELWRGKRDVEATRDTKSAVIAELKAEIAGLKTGYDAYEQVNAELKAEVDSLTREADRQYTTIEAYRKDAERFQWLLKNASVILHKKTAYPAETGFIKFDTMPGRTEIESAIDAAMSKGEQS